MRADREAKIAAYHAEVELENKRRQDAAEQARFEAQQRMEEERLKIQERIEAEQADREIKIK